VDRGIIAFRGLTELHLMLFAGLQKGTLERQTSLFEAIQSSCGDERIG
jgi:hypothetical protein